MLARLLRPQYQSAYITHLDTETGEPLTNNADISTTLLDYYTRLYKTRDPPGGQALMDYLQEIAMG